MATQIKLSLDASDQKCVSGEGSPNASKYDTFCRICHQLLTKKSEGRMSGRILVSMTWLKMVQSAQVTTITVTMAGIRRRMRRTQKPLRSMLPVCWNSSRRRRVMR